MNKMKTYRPWVMLSLLVLFLKLASAQKEETICVYIYENSLKKGDQVPQTQDQWRAAGVKPDRLYTSDSYQVKLQKRPVYTPKVTPSGISCPCKNTKKISAYTAEFDKCYCSDQFEIRQIMPPVMCRPPEKAVVYAELRSASDDMWYRFGLEVKRIPLDCSRHNECTEGWECRNIVTSRLASAVGENFVGSFCRSTDSEDNHTRVFFEKRFERDAALGYIDELQGKLTMMNLRLGKTYDEEGALSYDSVEACLKKSPSKLCQEVSVFFAGEDQIKRRIPPTWLPIVGDETVCLRRTFYFAFDKVVEKKGLNPTPEPLTPAVKDLTSLAKKPAQNTEQLKKSEIPKTQLDGLGLTLNVDGKKGNGAESFDPRSPPEKNRPLLPVENLNSSSLSKAPFGLQEPFRPDVHQDRPVYQEIQNALEPFQGPFGRPSGLSQPETKISQHENNLESQDEENYKKNLNLLDSQSRFKPKTPSNPYGNSGLQPSIGEEDNPLSSETDRLQEMKEDLLMELQKFLEKKISEALFLIVKAKINNLVTRTAKHEDRFISDSITLIDLCDFLGEVGLPINRFTLRWAQPRKIVASFLANFEKFFYAIKDNLDEKEAFVKSARAILDLRKTSTTLDWDKFREQTSKQLSFMQDAFTAGPFKTLLESDKRKCDFAASLERLATFVEGQFPIDNIYFQDTIENFLSSDDIRAESENVDETLKSLLIVFYQANFSTDGPFELSSMTLSAVANKIKALYLLLDVAGHLLCENFPQKSDEYMNEDGTKMSQDELERAKAKFREAKQKFKSALPDIFKKQAEKENARKQLPFGFPLAPYKKELSSDFWAYESERNFFEANQQNIKVKFFQEFAAFVDELNLDAKENLVRSIGTLKKVPAQRFEAMQAFVRSVQTLYNNLSAPSEIANAKIIIRRTVQMINFQNLRKTEAGDENSIQNLDKQVTTCIENDKCADETNGLQRHLVRAII